MITIVMIGLITLFASSLIGNWHPTGKGIIMLIELGIAFLMYIGWRQ